MNNNKPTDEPRNIKAIMFDRKGNMIRGDFRITDIINLMERRDDIKTLALYNTPGQSHIHKTAVPANHKVSESFHVDNLKQCLIEETYKEPPALVLLVPKYG